MRELKGIQASPGIAIGKAFIFSDENTNIPNYSIETHQVFNEWTRFLEAIESAKADVTILRDRADKEMGEENSAIFESHLLMLSDPDLIDQIEENLKSSLKNIEWIVFQYEQKLVKKLSESKDQYIRERSADIHDISNRILNNLLKIENATLEDISEEVILITHDLMPSDAISIDKKSVLGIAMDAGGKTSHTAIIARAFNIPAVLGLGDVHTTVRNGETIIIDGNTGTVIINPDPETERNYRKLRDKSLNREKELLNQSNLVCETRDKIKIGIKANIEFPNEVESTLKHGAEGIGLYRSEFLFLKPGNFATEETQYNAYAQVLKAMGDKPVTIRTLDLGGDKIIPEIESQKEKNPLLGWRAIRFCLTRQDIFKSQLQALLRASVLGNLRIMFPMISGPEELDCVLEVLEEVKENFRVKKIPFNENIPIGIMIEIPSAAMVSDILAKKVSFFSIGTNDLIQYTIAVDRGNEKTAYLYQPYHPGIIRLLKLIIDNANAAGIECSMCGEMAGDCTATPLLIGLGLREFSMSSQSLPSFKHLVRSITSEEINTLTSLALSMASYKDIDELLTQFSKTKKPLSM